MRIGLGLCSLFLLLVVAIAGRAWAQPGPALDAMPAAPPAAPAAASGLDHSIDALVAAARTAATQPCDGHADKLRRILCAGRLRVGIRSNYPRFGTVSDGQATGYEVAIARGIAQRLGVEPIFTPVTPATRIAALGEDRVDLVIATMGHTTQRDAQARFIRPHYYASRTVIVGPRTIPIRSWADLSGATVCVPIGAFSSTVLIEHNVRLLLFDNPDHLLDALQRSACRLVAHDDSFFAEQLAHPGFAALYEAKFGFATLPWGMAVARDGTLELARLLSLLGQIGHRDGVFLRLAEQNGVATDFLRQQQAVWNRPDCDRAAGVQDSTCILPPVDSSLARLGFADDVDRFQDWLRDRLGLPVVLPMLQTVVAFQLFRNGLLYTVVLVLGAMACTLLVAVAVAALLRSPRPAVQRLTTGLTLVLQSSPIVLLLFVGYTVATGITQYSVAVAIVTSVLVLGLFNGSHAGRAIAETYGDLRRERGGAPPGALLLASRSSGQVTSFLINASKGSAAASMIGTPELLGAMTDISSFSSERITLYSLLMLMYLGLVLVIIALCNGLRRALARREHAA